MDTTQEIVFNRGGIAVFYFGMAIIFAVMGILFILAGVGGAVEPGPWRDKWADLAMWLVFGVSWIAGAPSMWLLGRAARQTEVRIGASEATFKLAGGRRYQIIYAEVRSLHWNPKRNVRALTIDTGNEQYKFDQRSCPRIGKVAEILGERCAAKLQVV
jgi:hypothetical protein